MLRDDSLQGSFQWIMQQHTHKMTSTHTRHGYLFETKDSLLFRLARTLCDLVKHYVATLSLNCSRRSLNFLHKESCHKSSTRRAFCMSGSLRVGQVSTCWPDRLYIFSSRLSRDAVLQKESIDTWLLKCNISDRIIVKAHASSAPNRGKIEHVSYMSSHRELC